jgi:hypothetical protein
MLQMRDKKLEKTVSSKNNKMELPYSSNCTIPALYKIMDWLNYEVQIDWRSGTRARTVVSQPISRSISQYNLSVSTVSQMQSVHLLSHYNHPIISTNQSVQSVSTACIANQSVVRSVNQ